MSAKHEVEKAQMRKWVVTSILDSERNYVNMLDVLLQVGPGWYYDRPKGCPKSDPEGGREK